MSRKLYTLLLITNEQSVLLGMKKRGLGEGKWNGFGGKPNIGETILDAAVRELKEECGLVVQSKDLVPTGIMQYEYTGDPVLMEVHLFTTSIYTGNPVESEEMKPQWFNLTEVPFHEMWCDDVVWYPLFLAGKKFRGYFKFQNHDVMLSHDIKEVDSL